MQADKKLFTPGPLTTTYSVKQAMLKDLGSRDDQFIQIIKNVQTKLIEIAVFCSFEGLPNDEYTVVLMQGSGTFGVESVFQTCTKLDESNVLVLENGAYGQRIEKICKLLSINHKVLRFPEDRAIDCDAVKSFLEKDNNYTHVAVIHGETTSGALNNVEKIGQLVKTHIPNSILIVDSMSAFGAVPVDIQKGFIDFLISSSNKCIQSVPGFSFVICSIKKLLSFKNNSRSLSLDLVDQYENMLKTNQFRFTPPTHSILAFKQALDELEQEGGPQKRYERYSNNHEIVRKGLLSIGFKELVPHEEQSKIINTFHYPNDENFNFEEFYKRLSDKGMVIYPGKMTKASCFRIGSIGALFAEDMHQLVQLIVQILRDMNVKIPIQY
ncbi:2-aminoethylphosphonate--pyruvate transaminase [Brachionus plicatilis]|uniref:Alanine--glyoxylate aminotransferase n=1 Tax=Brachionus plicatilis TaxID=10195 RepID=A0A3M7R276_BRAPC|nr:2-aminoethylphosphonate--pyruvate transaminase [Brachionus plicatilis]